MSRQRKLKTGLPILFATVLYSPFSECTAQSSGIAASLKEAALRALQGDRDSDGESVNAPAPVKPQQASSGNQRSANAAKQQADSHVINRYEQGKKRYVHANRAFVRSGPGDACYPTAVLARGSEVEVYLETSDGWSAVRPVANSHNWIPATVAFLLPGGSTAEITEDEVPAWVGSQLDQPKKLSWQTSLLKGQIVQVLGEQTQTSENGGQTLWYKIAPPQGEFRWVRTSLLSSEQILAPELEVQQASHNANNMQGGDVVRASAQAASEDGEIVWSDEAEVLADINRQIRNEQSQIDRALPQGAIRQGTRYVNGNDYSDGEVIDGEIYDGEYYIDGESSGVGPDEIAYSVDEAMAPEDLAKAKRHKNAQHQVDSLRHWDSLEASDPKLKLKPLASVLGLIGFGVVETERMPPGATAGGANLPVQSQIALERNQFPNGSLAVGQTLPNLNAPTGSRLDRLPRPGRSAKVSTPRSGRDPLAGIGDQSLANSTLGNPQSGGGSGASSGFLPLDPNTPVLSRLWNSDQPIFGSGVNPGYANNGTAFGSQGMLHGGQFAQAPLVAPAGQSFASSNQWYALNPAATAVPPSLAYAHQSAAGVNPEWHADHRQSTVATSQVMQEAFTDPLSEAEFETPEIQLAMLDLTRIVAQPTETWNLNHLRDQCHRWIDQGGSSLVRGEARLLLERVDRFDALRSRTLGGVIDPSRIASGSNGAGSGAANAASLPVQFASSTNQMGNGNSWGVAPASNQSTVQAASAHGVPGVAEASARAGDASGWLVQVHGSLPGQPEFALTDDQGNVVTYVQTTAALNIRRYLQQPVIIYGQRGYIPNLAARQITVEKIARLR